MCPQITKCKEALRSIATQGGCSLPHAAQQGLFSCGTKVRQYWSVSPVILTCVCVTLLCGSVPVVALVPCCSWYSLEALDQLFDVSTAQLQHRAAWHTHAGVEHTHSLMQHCQ